MMPLRRFPPISRAAEWRCRVVSRDPVTGRVQDLTDTAFTLALCRIERCWGIRDYGRWFDRDCTHPPEIALFAQTLVDNVGVFTILPGQTAAEFAFPPEAVAALRPGSYLLLVVIQDAYGTREIVRETVVVLPGGPILPALNGSAGLLSGSNVDLAGSDTNLAGTGAADPLPRPAFGGDDLNAGGDDTSLGGVDFITP